MSTEKRTIKINPDLFKVSEKNTSRKKKEKGDVKIKVKTDKPAKNKSLRRSVLKMIREKQQEEYKKLFSNEKEIPKKSQSNTSRDDFNKDFESSIEYFNSLVEKEKEKEFKNDHNHTIKRYPEEPTQNIYENVSMELPNVFNDIVPVTMSPPINIHQPPQNRILVPSPKYGCLKNGSLPTYRSFYNTTRRSYPAVEEIEQKTMEIPTVEKTINTEIQKDLSEKRQKFQKEEFMKAGKKRMKYLKRRKIYKRTYKVGRSQTRPQISVLVSNKTIRNRITTEAQLLKQTPIHEVKQFLIKKGFIKVGTTTPNDVLRKMYESVSLICGEVQNHNPENLLYNFMNDENKS
jgi:hypothetical protein